MYISLAWHAGTDGVVDVANVDAEVVLRGVDSEVAEVTLGVEVGQGFVSPPPAEVDDVGVGRGDAGQQDVAGVLSLSDGTLRLVCWSKHTLS